MPPDPRQGEAWESLPESQLQELGRVLAEGRVERGFSLEELARKLHMGVEQLRTLEKADRAKLPELVFVIAQARRIASVLELSIDPLIDALRQDARSLAKTTGATSKAKVAPPSRPVAIRQVVTDEVQLPISSPQESLAHEGSERAGSERAVSAAEPVPQQRSGSVVALLQPLAVLALVAGVASAGTALWRHGLSSSGSAPAAPVPAPQPAAPRPAMAATSLVLRSKHPSWLEVRTRQGQRLHFGILRGERSFPNPSGLEVRAGRPDLITVTTASGTSRVLGRIDQLRWWLVQPDGKILPLPGKPA